MLAIASANTVSGEVAHKSFWGSAVVIINVVSVVVMESEITNGKGS
jgi:hypothetical protein